MLEEHNRRNFESHAGEDDVIDVGEFKAMLESFGIEGGSDDEIQAKFNELAGGDDGISREELNAWAKRMAEEEAAKATPADAE